MASIVHAYRYDRSTWSSPSSSPLLAMLSLVGGSEDAETALMRLASSRPSLMELFYRSLESEVVGPYMASRRRHHTDEKWAALVYGMHTSRTVYVGNLSFATREEQVHELFARVAAVRRVIMGLNANTRTPCGFCFVEYFNHDDAQAATRVLNGLKLDDRVMKADLDAAFEEGRQYGRGRGGGQITDDHRADFDAARGGWGTLQQARKERADAAERVKQAQLDTFGSADAHDGYEEEVLDVDTYGGGYERPSASSIFNVDRPVKLSAATLAACTPGVFPYYGLPVDTRVREAIDQHLGITSKAVVTPVVSASESQFDGAKRSPRPASVDASSSLSPATKRPRHTPPRDDDEYDADHTYQSRSPQPRSPQPRSPPPRSPQPRSPQPRSPQPNYYYDDDDHAMSGAYTRSDDDGDRTPQHLSDGDRTPPPGSDGDRTPQHLDDDGDRTPQHLSDGDRTPQTLTDRDDTRMHDDDDDPDRTPQHVSDPDRTPQHVDDDPDRTPQRMDDDDPDRTPQHVTDEHNHETNDNQTDFDAFEK